MRNLALIVLGVTASLAGAADPKPFPGTRGTWNGFAKYEFTTDGSKATAVVPARPLPGRPWVWRGEFFGAFAEADIALVKEGWHLIYLNVPDLFGSPKAIAKWEKFYGVLTKEYGLHPRPGLIGLSRGGLYCMNWAAAHPDRTLAVYLDNAVCDFKSWPGGKRLSLGSGKGSEAEWKKLLSAYGFKSDAEAIAYKLNPVDNLAPLAKAKIPLLIVYGDSDTVVPHAENGGLVYTRYKALGGPVERVVKPGQDHHPHGLKDVRPVVNFFRAARVADAKAGRPAGVRHEPATPKPGVPVLVTARLPKGATRMTLRVQAVDPGKYIRKTDPAYEKEWTDLPMRDDGRDGDAKGGDGVYSALVPASYQRHRRLLRYRVVATDSAGGAVRSPGPDDDCPNFAWWCDAGPAAWTGASHPGKTAPSTFSSEFLGTLQSLTLLARAEDVTRSQWDGAAHKQKQQGTLVYRGVVYDHIEYRNRGQGSAHIAGKNKWGLKFNRGHKIPFVDHDGLPSPAPVGSLNLNPGCSTPYLPVLRGIGGLDEVMSMRAYRLAGVPSPSATWVQWRVVSGADEASAKDQYAGDLWGLYVAIGDMDPRQLADRRLPDGLSVSIQSGIKHAPRGMADAPKVWEKFLSELRSDPNEDWCRKNLDLNAYYSFHALNRLLGNVDLRPDGNHGYYRRPDGRWAPIPWDNDMMFVPRHHQPGHIDAVRCLRHPAVALEYRNRAREILDLFASDGGERGGQVGQLAADLGAALTPKKFTVDWPRLDEARWNHHPRMNPKGVFYANPYEASYWGGPWKRTLATADFAGFRKYLVDFCTDTRPGKKYAPNDGDQRGYGWGYLAHEARDDKIPATPKVGGSPGGRRFEAAAFASPTGQKPAALEWRVGRVGRPGWYELEERWRKESASARTIDIPAEVFKEPGEYRVRARWRDGTGRCSHWSAPVTVSVR
jgi:pimeloyl-ACP methyl ester carboxylesterase